MRTIKPNTKPETKLQQEITNFLKIRDWMVKWTHGNLYQSGFPDMFAAHLRYGTRWIEVKIKDHYSFTNAQLETFPEFSAKGVGIWILTGATEEEYRKLMGPANWHMFLSVMKMNSR